MWEHESLGSHGGADQAQSVTAARDQRYDRADAQLILLMRGLRSLAYGMLAVLLSVSLSTEGFSPVAIGILITVSLAGDMVGTYVIGIAADGWGRRRALALLALLMAGTGVIFGLTNFYALLLVAAFFGTLGITASETAPFLPIDQAMIAQITKPEHRTALFARYNLVASFSVAVGALSAGLPGLLALLGLPLATGIRLIFGVYALLALIVAVLTLSPRVEAPRSVPAQVKGAWQRLVPPLGPSRGIIMGLAGLFCVDALAGGLVVQSLMVLFFHLRFGISLVWLSALFFGANLLSALSFLAAVPLARRFGLLNTMVFTHLPSNVLLILVAFAPTFPLAAAILLLRQRALADGCTDPAGLHHGYGCSGGTNRSGQRDFAGSQCRLIDKPGLCRTALAGTITRAGTAFHPRRGYSNLPTILRCGSSFVTCI